MISKGEIVYAIFQRKAHNDQFTATQAPGGGPSSWGSYQKLSETPSTHLKDDISDSKSVMKGLLGQAI